MATLALFWWKDRPPAHHWWLSQQLCFKESFLWQFHSSGPVTQSLDLHCLQGTCGLPITQSVPRRHVPCPAALTMLFVLCAVCCVQVPGGYLCRMQDGDLRYMLAFPNAQVEAWPGRGWGGRGWVGCTQVRHGPGWGRDEVRAMGRQAGRGAALHRQPCGRPAPSAALIGPRDREDGSWLATKEHRGHR